MVYHPPPPGTGGAGSLPPRPRLDFRPPPSGPHGGRRGGGGGRDRGHGGHRDSYRPSNGGGSSYRGGDRDQNGQNGQNGQNRQNSHYHFGQTDHNSGFAPPRGEFTFRRDKPAGVHEAQQRGDDHYAPRDRDRGGRGGRDRRNERRGGGRDYNSNFNSRRNGGRGGRGGRGNFANSRFLAANRPILSQTATGAGNNGVVQDFVKDNEGTKYLDFDDLSDSDEAAMDLSDDEQPAEAREGEVGAAGAAGEAGEASDDEDGRPRKRARRVGPTKDKASEAPPPAPKWSNPDPYTALPPPDAVKRKDVVQLIRKARVQQERAAAVVTEDTEDFISFGMDSDDEQSGKNGKNGKSGKNGRGSQSKPDADEKEISYIHISDTSSSGDSDEEGEIASDAESLGRVERIGRNGKLGGAASSAPAVSSESSESTGTGGANASDGHAAASKQTPAPSSLAGDLNTNRKRTHDDELKPLVPLDQAVLKRVNKMPVGGNIVPAWQPQPREPSCPWVQKRTPADASSYTTHMGVWMHKEILEFYDFVRPRDFEQAVRQGLLDDLSNSIRRRFVNGRIHCFGSFMSGLYLPTGDMDIVMCSTQFLNNRAPMFNKKGHLFKFGAFLCQNNLAEREHLEHITKAKVPLVKYVDLATGLKVDVSFENMNGVVANKTFADWKAQFPEMPILVTIIKQFLAMRGLNEPVNGGIGGFSIICLVVSMLQLMPPLQTKDMDASTHLGDLLMHFFDLYGNKFNYETTAISLNPPKYIAKHKVQNFTYKNPDRLSIIDPNNAENDISGGSKNTAAIMREFSEAYDALQRRMVDLAQLPVDQRAAHSILGVILQGDYSSYRHQRDYLNEVYLRRQNRQPRSY